MFYETKVLDAYGNLKAIITAQELHTRHWKTFHNMEKTLSPYTKKTKSNIKKERKLNDFNS